VSVDAAPEPEDPFLWLEEVEGRRARAWVEARSAATRSAVARDPAYESLRERSLRILDSRDRIAMPDIRGGRLYNFWQDASNPRGVLRRTSWAAYVAGAPDWETVLDVDALAAAEDVPWAFGGTVDLPPAHRRCLLRLSRGGADAVEAREFDLQAMDFVPGGFRLPEAKQSAAWIDGDTLLVATDFGPGSMSDSGYPRVVRRWRRGTPLDAAEPLYEAPATHMGVWVAQVQTADRAHLLVLHRTSFYEGTTHLLEGDDPVRLDVPLDADVHLLRDMLLVYLRSPWRVGGREHAGASIVAIRLKEFLDGGRDFRGVLRAGPREAIEAVAVTRDHLVVSMLAEVRGELRRLTPGDGEWAVERVPAPEPGSVAVVAASPETNRWFFAYSGFTTPTTLFLAEEDGGAVALRSLPPMFDAQGLAVEQQEAVSRDGTRVPFFLVRSRGAPDDGSSPTLLYGYGGFEVSLTPAYGALMGASWLERGGTYVVANTRGGGEFGPGWHRAALREKRQRAFDDFIAIAEALIARGITSPARLGIMGGSNGGLLVGAVMTQRPELFGAVVIQVPLLDMRRYHRLLAGASWMAEYGDPDSPDDWAYIRAWSPYHNVRAGTRYPPVLITTTTRDDRVHPGHARKMAALLESLGHDVHYFENTEGGHGTGVTNEQRATISALTWTWLHTALTPP
jgi:prolyl oligopeptidase